MDISDMINETKYSLRSADADLVQLCFMQKRSSSPTKKSWGLFLLKSFIDKSVGQEFINGARNQFDEIPKDVEYAKYGVLTGTDRNIIEYALSSEVQRLNEAIVKLANPTAMADFSQDNIDDLWGYVVYIECDDYSLALFNKYAASKVPLKTLTLSFMGGKQLARISSPTLVLSTYCDVAVLLPKNSDFDNLPVCIFNEWKFETLFGYYDIYQRKIEVNKEDVCYQLLVDDPESFVNACLQNPLKTKKMHNIVQHSELVGIKEEQIEKINLSYDLGLTFKDGKIVTNKQNAWTILRLYSDDCVRSACTDSRYLAYSKKKVGKP